MTSAVTWKKVKGAKAAIRPSDKEFASLREYIDAVAESRRDNRIDLVTPLQTTANLGYANIKRFR